MLQSKDKTPKMVNFTPPIEWNPNVLIHSIEVNTQQSTENSPTKRESLVNLSDEQLPLNDSHNDSNTVSESLAIVREFKEVRRLLERTFLCKHLDWRIFNLLLFKLYVANRNSSA